MLVAQCSNIYLSLNGIATKNLNHFVLRYYPWNLYKHIVHRDQNEKSSLWAVSFEQLHAQGLVWSFQKHSYDCSWTNQLPLYWINQALLSSIECFWCQRWTISQISILIILLSGISSSIIAQGNWRKILQNYQSLNRWGILMTLGWGI
jgi:hypothetical protein